MPLSSPSTAESTTAPAPSPNRTQVARSSQSRMRLNVSEPITERMIGHAALHHIVGDGEGVEEAGADRLHVEGDAIVDAEHRLDAGRARREGLVRGRGGEDDEADLAGLDARRRQRLPRRLGRQRRGRLAVAGDVARLDAGALDDPFVRGVDPLGELGIGHPPRGQRRSGAGDPRPPHASTPFAARAETLARSSVILRVMSSRTIRAATRIALATPLSVALPWLFTTRPLRPRKTAPL